MPIDTPPIVSWGMNNDGHDITVGVSVINDAYNMRSFLGVKTPSWSHMGKQDETLSTNSLSILMTGTMAPQCNILFFSLWRFKNPAKN